jgi:hypothetical protein
MRTLRVRPRVEELAPAREPFRAQLADPMQRRPKAGAAAPSVAFTTPSSLGRARTIAALMAVKRTTTTVPQPSGPKQSGGRRVERSCCFARNGGAAFRGRRSRARRCGREAASVSERIVVADPPAKGRTGSGG